MRAVIDNDIWDIFSAKLCKEIEIGLGTDLDGDTVVGIPSAIRISVNSYDVRSWKETRPSPRRGAIFHADFDNCEIVILYL